MGVLFDKLSFVRKLDDGGTFSRPQAERLSEALHDVVGESVATKLDLVKVRTEVGHLRMDLDAHN